MSETLSNTDYADTSDIDAEGADVKMEADAPPQAAETAPEAAEPRAPKTVPLAVLMREREEKRQIQEQFERGNARLEQLLAAFQQQQAPQPAARPAPTIPDINTDPVGHFAAKQEAAERELAEIKEWRARQEQQAQGQSQEQQFIAAYTTDAAKFASKQADFPAAYNHVKESLVRDFLEAGYTPQDAIAELQDQERKIAARAFREGRSPAEAIYRLAKARGFTGVPQADPAARMEAMQRGQAAARTTAGPGARGRFEGLTVESLANMSDAEFARVPQNIVNRLLGG